MCPIAPQVATVSGGRVIKSDTERDHGVSSLPDLFTEENRRRLVRIARRTLGAKHADAVQDVVQITIL